MNLEKVMFYVPVTIVGLMATILLGGCLVSFSGGAYNNYSEGIRSGVIQKYSNKGLIWKSGEGVLLMQGIHNEKRNNVNVLVNNTFDFSVTDPEISKQVEAASGKNVNLHYKQWFIGPMQQNTSYTIVKVEVVKE